LGHRSIERLGLVGLEAAQLGGSGEWAAIGGSGMDKKPGTPRLGGVKSQKYQGMHGCTLSENAVDVKAVDPDRGI